MVKDCYVYALVNSSDMSIFYIGSTILDMYFRFSQHVSMSKVTRKEYQPPVYYWIRENKVRFHYVVLETKRINTRAYFSIEKLRKREKFWMKEMVKRGFDLKNKCMMPKILA